MSFNNTEPPPFQFHEEIVHRAIPAVEVITRNLNGHIFLEVDNEIISFEDLRKYRKVCIENAYYLYLTEIFIATVQLILSFFSKSIPVILLCCCSLLSSLLLFYSLRLVSYMYNWIAGIGLVLGISSSSLLVYRIILVRNVSLDISFVISLISVLYFFLLFSLTYYAQRLQTIIKVTPSELYNSLL